MQGLSAHFGSTPHPCDLSDLMAPKKRDDKEARLEVLAQFKKFDLNSDNKISLQELLRVLQFLDSASWTDRKVTQLFHEMDRDGNNKVDKDEFVDFVFGRGAQPKALNKSFADLPKWEDNLQAEAQAKQRLVDEQRDRLLSPDAAVRVNEFTEAKQGLDVLDLHELQCASSMADENGKFCEPRVGAVAEACCVLTGLRTAQIRGSTQGEGNYEGLFRRMLPAAEGLDPTTLSASTLSQAAAVLISQRKKAGVVQNDEEEPPGLSLLFQIDDLSLLFHSHDEEPNPVLVWKALARWACAVVAVGMHSED